MKEPTWRPFSDEPLRKAIREMIDSLEAKPFLACKPRVLAKKLRKMLEDTK